MCGSLLIYQRHGEGVSALRTRVRLRDVCVRFCACGLARTEKVASHTRGMIGLICFHCTNTVPKRDESARTRVQSICAYILRFENPQSTSIYTITRVHRGLWLVLPGQPRPDGAAHLISYANYRPCVLAQHDSANSRAFGCVWVFVIRKYNTSTRACGVVRDDDDDDDGNNNTQMCVRCGALNNTAGARSAIHSIHILCACAYAEHTYRGMHAHRSGWVLVNICTVFTQTHTLKGTH